MKQPLIYLLFLLLTISGSSYAQTNDTSFSIMAVKKHHNKIDDITSSKEIEKLLVNIDKDYDRFTVNDSMKFTFPADQHFADSLKVQKWTKADFDNNGYTDILVVGNWYDHAVVCIMDLGENNFKVNNVTRRSFQDPTYPIVQTIGQTSVIFYYSTEQHFLFDGKIIHPLKCDTLIYKYGDFIEYHNKSAKHTIEKIEYSTGGCFGTCPIFDLTIKGDRTAIYKANEYNKRSGKFKGTIDSIHYNELTDLLNYIDFEKLDSSYSVNWTDDQSCTLKITYDSGKTKKIEDYGLIGTYGLDRAYAILFRLRENQTWK